MSDCNSEHEAVELSENEDYIDFRTYEVYIDWQEVENERSQAYQVWQSHGTFALALFSALTGIKELKFNSKKFLFNILKYYSNLQQDFLKHQDNDVFKKINLFVNLLPELETIQRLVNTRNYNKKDLFSINLVLKIYENYLSTCVEPQKYKIYIRTKLEFYRNLSKENYDFLIEKMTCDNEIKSLIGKEDTNYNNYNK